MKKVLIHTVLLFLVLQKYKKSRPTKREGGFFMFALSHIAFKNELAMFHAGGHPRRPWEDCFWGSKDSA